MPIITRAQLALLAPHALPAMVAGIADHADEVLPREGINTALRLQHFLAHVLVESASLTALSENLNYSAERLHAVWPKRFPTVASAKPYARNPKALGNKVYGGRMGNTGPDEGWLNRGQGLLETTGHANIAALAAHLGTSFEVTRAMLTSEAGMLQCAAETFVMLGCLPAADKDDILTTTRLVNGGTNGLAERRTALALVKRVIPRLVLPAAASASPAISVAAVPLAVQPKALAMKLPFFATSALIGFGLSVADAAPIDVSSTVTGSLDLASVGALGLLGTAGAVLVPFLARYLGHQASVIVMARVEQLLERALGYAVEMARKKIAEHGPFTVDPGNFLIEQALQFVSDNAARFGKSIKVIEQKLVARLDSHLGVQTLRAEIAVAGAGPAGAEASAAVASAIAGAAAGAVAATVHVDIPPAVTAAVAEAVTMVVGAPLDLVPAAAAL